MTGTEVVGEHLANVLPLGAVQQGQGKEVVETGLLPARTMVGVRGFAKKNNSKNPRLLWKWVGGSRSHSEFFFGGGNHPKIALNQY